MTRYTVFSDIEDGRNKVLIMHSKAEALEFCKATSGYFMIRGVPMDVIGDYVPRNHQDELLHSIQYALKRNEQMGRLRLEGYEFIIEKRKIIER